MNIKKIAGWLLLFFIFGGLFAYMWLSSSIAIAIFAFAATALLVGLIMLAVYLISD